MWLDKDSVNEWGKALNSDLRTFFNGSSSFGEEEEKGGGEQRILPPEGQVAMPEDTRCHTGAASVTVVETRNAAQHPPMCRLPRVEN